MINIRSFITQFAALSWLTTTPICAEDIKPLVIPLPASGIVYDPIGKKIWACIGNSAKGEFPNSIVSIDPLNGKLSTPVFIGSEPSHLTLSANSKYLYAAVSDGRSVRRFEIGSGTPGLHFPVGPGLAVTTMAPMPGDPDSVVIMRHTPGISPNDAGVAVYTNGVPKPSIVGAGHHLAQGITPTRMFGYENQISSWGFTALNLTKDGVTAGPSTGSLLQGNVGLVGSANGLIIHTSGGVVDPEARLSVGQMPGTGPDAILLPDGSTGKVYQFAGHGSGVNIRVYDLRRFVMEREFSVPLPSSPNGALNPIRWGERGLAFTTGASIAILNEATSPQAAMVDLAVRRDAPAKVGTGQFSYVLTVTNRSAASSSGVFLTDQVPDRAEVLSVKASQGTAVYASGAVRADLGRLARGASAEVLVRLQLGSPERASFTAVARGLDPDPSTENNIDRFAASPQVEPVATPQPSTSGMSTAARPGMLPDIAGTWTKLVQTASGSGVNLRAVVAGQFRVDNRGGQRSGACVVRFYLSSAPEFRASTSQLIQETMIAMLPPNKSVNVVLNAPLGGGDDATGLYVFAVLDATEAVKESSESNNVVREIIK